MDISGIDILLILLKHMMNKLPLKTLTAVVSLCSVAYTTASAQTIIDINGYLATSTATDGEWGDNSTRGDTSGSGASAAPFTNVPDDVSDDDGTVSLTFSANGQGWRTGFSSGAYSVGQEWNVRSSYSATTAEAAFTQGGYFEMTLDSTTNGSALFDLDAFSVSLWRNGTGADTMFQLAIDLDNDGWDVGDLVGSAITPAAAMGTGNTISYSGLDLPDSVTTASMRLYTWGNSSINGNIHIYDASATYTVVPEPGSFALIAGMLGLAAVSIRRRRS